MSLFLPFCGGAPDLSSPEAVTHRLADVINAPLYGTEGFLLFFFSLLFYIATKGSYLPFFP